MHGLGKAKGQGKGKLRGKVNIKVWGSYRKDTSDRFVICNTINGVFGWMRMFGMGRR